jgi:hypothetical protein
MKIGACWFDNNKQAFNGWASSCGSPAFRVSSFGDLPPDTLWVTNLNYITYRKLNLTKVHHIVDEQYFRTSMRQIGAETGLLNNPVELVVFASKVFSRIGLMGRELLSVNINNPGYRYTSLLAASITPNYVRSRIIGPNAMDISEAIKQSFQSNQAMVGINAPKNSTVQAFSYPRGAFARWILSQDYPGSEPWEEIPERNFSTTFGYDAGHVIKGTVSVTERLLDIGKNHAALFRINILTTDPAYQNFATFGAGSNHPRRWATLPEVLLLSKYCKVKLSGGYKTTFRKLPIAEKINLNDSEYSYSRGLLYENIWVSLSNPIHGNDIFHAVGAYMRAYDRIACFSLADGFAAQQYTIGSYGTGRAMIYLTDAESQRAAELAIGLGALPPFTKGAVE